MAEQSVKRIVVLSVDWLNISYLGAYGNTWISTPNMDRLAAQSLVMDRAVIDTPETELQYRSLWQGSHAMVSAERAAGSVPLAEQFSRAGWYTALITDEPAVANSSPAESFSDRMFLKIAARDTLSKSVEATGAAEFFAAAIDLIDKEESPSFFWLHTGTLGHAWDAPPEFREQYRDEDDPPIHDSPDVPNHVLAEQFDPDELLQMTHAYAGQVALLDQFVASLVGTINESVSGSDSLFVLTSPRGFPLGEHRRVGRCDLALYSELTHVPLVLRFPEHFQAAGRATPLVQPADLSATLLAAAGLPTIAGHKPGSGRSFLAQGHESSATFDRACTIAPNQRAIVTPAWSLRLSEETIQPSQRLELFANPDDWFEVNEVSNRCPDVAAELQSLLAEFETACGEGAPAELSELPGHLIFGLE